MPTPVGPPDSEFIGNNTIVLCAADLMKGIEWYLNEVVLKSRVKVTNITQNSTDGTFSVKVSPPDKKPL